VHQDADIDLRVSQILTNRQGFDRGTYCCTIVALLRELIVSLLNKSFGSRFFGDGDSSTTLSGRLNVRRRGI
jgi:hypothetical protein